MAMEIVAMMAGDSFIQLCMGLSFKCEAKVYPLHKGLSSFAARWFVQCCKQRRAIVI
jgi:hypothetical protein